MDPAMRFMAAWLGVAMVVGTAVGKWIKGTQMRDLEAIKADYRRYLEECGEPVPENDDGAPREAAGAET
jgi:hypothetical protein